MHIRSHGWGECGTRSLRPATKSTKPAHIAAFVDFVWRTARGQRTRRLDAARPRAPRRPGRPSGTPHERGARRGASGGEPAVGRSAVPIDRRGGARRTGRRGGARPVVVRVEEPGGGPLAVGASFPETPPHGAGPQATACRTDPRRHGSVSTGARHVE